MRSGRFEWLPAVLAAVALVVFAAAFAYELVAYQGAVTGWAKGDLEARARLAAENLEEPLRTQDFRTIQRVGAELVADGLRLRVTGIRGGIGMVYDTHRDSDGGYLFSGRCASGEYDVILAVPRARVTAPFRRALLGFVLAGLVGMAGVLLFFLVTYRQRVRIRELAKTEKFRREFIADVSHEIKTPLTGILGAVEMMGEGDQGSGLRDQLLGMIQKEAGRLNGLVQSILDLARLEQEEDMLHLAETDLGELVRESAAKYPCTCTVESSAVARCDAQLVGQAVENLIGNAVRHSGSDEIAVMLDCDATTVRIAVEDHGVGVPPEHAARIFERFHRVDPARAAETGGAGLGLAIVRRIARLHGGDVTLEPVRPHGCRFVLSVLRNGG